MYTIVVDVQKWKSFYASSICFIAFASHMLSANKQQDKHFNSYQRQETTMMISMAAKAMIQATKSTSGAKRTLKKGTTSAAIAAGVAGLSTHQVDHKQ